nr:DUF2158 domain-containing protein [Mesorhizobium sp. B1-1-4]
MAFQKGEIVVLKSGGPKMTVTDPKAYGGQVDTSWFAGGKLQGGRFPPDALEYPKEEKK